MRKTNEDIDYIIKKALSEEDAQFYDKLDEQNLPEMWMSIYKGKMKWITIYATFIQIVLTVIAFYVGYQFFSVDTVKDMVFWGVIFLFLIHAVSMLKLYHWNQMDKNSIKREIKRLELQVSLLTKGKSTHGNKS